MRGRNLGRTLELEGGDDGEVIRKKGNIAGVGRECSRGRWVASCPYPTARVYVNSRLKS
jgi:hypothetical protein